VGDGEAVGIAVDVDVKVTAGDGVALTGPAVALGLAAAVKLAGTVVGLAVACPRGAGLGLTAT